MGFIHTSPVSVLSSSYFSTLIPLSLSFLFYLLHCSISSSQIEMEPPRDLIPTTAVKGRGGHATTHPLAVYQTHTHTHSPSHNIHSPHGHGQSHRNPPPRESTLETVAAAAVASTQRPSSAPSGVVLHQGRFRSTTLGCFLDTPMNTATGATPAALFGSYHRPQSSPGTRPVFTGWS